MLSSAAKKPDTGMAQYEDFDPEFDNKEEPAAYVLRVYLPDFVKQQLKVTYDDSTNKMRARGERPLGIGNHIHRWSRFDREFTIPDNCIVSRIRAKFEKNVLIITMPKKVITQLPPQPNKQQEAAAEPKKHLPSETTSNDNFREDNPARSPTPMPNKARAQPKPQKGLQDSSADDAENERKNKAVSPPKPSSKRTHKRVEDEKRKEPASASQDPWNKEKEKSGGYHYQEEARDLVSSAKQVMGKLAKRVKEDESSRQSLINTGVAAVVIVALGAYIAYTIGSRESKN